MSPSPVDGPRDRLPVEQPPNPGEARDISPKQLRRAVAWWDGLAASELAAAGRAGERGDRFRQEHHSRCHVRNRRIADGLRERLAAGPLPADSTGKAA
jgi:hypothetical protein